MGQWKGLSNEDKVDLTEAARVEMEILGVEIK